MVCIDQTYRIGNVGFALGLFFACVFWVCCFLGVSSGLVARIHLFRFLPGLSQVNELVEQLEPERRTK